MNKLLITGGHPTPAIAVIDEIRKRRVPVSIVFVGRKYNNDGERTLSFEYQEMQHRSIPFVHLTAGRLTRILSVQSLVNILRIPGGFFRAFHIILTEKPDIILSFGGYLALPVACAAWILHIPVYSHEQTIEPGLANRLIAILARRIFVSFPSSQAFFPGKKTIVTGNPMRPELFERQTPFAVPSNLPVIYVTGGSLGAHAINSHIAHIISRLVASAVVIHQTGNVEAYNDYEHLQKIHAVLPAAVRGRYIIKQHISSDQIGSAFGQSDLVISRAGANTFFELVALQKPAILIPLPWSAHDEQSKHAAVLAEAGAAEVFEQTGNSETLLQLILQMLEDLPRYTESYARISHTYQNEGRVKIIEEIFGNHAPPSGERKAQS